MSGSSMPPQPTGVLSGIKVADFTRVFSGPAATQMLGDLGADVIKVEDPGTGDPARVFGMSDNSGHPLKGASAAFIALNRNKRSIGLDLKAADGRAVARRLIAASHVLVHNFRPGVMERLGLAYEEVSKDNPGLVYCEISGYGNVGPLAGRGANDLALQAHSGLISITGTVEGEMVRCGSAVIDLHCGSIATNAILAALLQRARTGKGQRVEASLLAASADLMSYFYGEYWLDGTIPKPMGTGNRLGVPNQAFPTTDGAVIIVANDDDMWRRIAQAVAPAQLDLPEFRQISGRRKHRVRLIAAITAITRALSTEQLLAQLEAGKVVASPLLDVAQAADHPQLAAIGGVEEVRIEDVPVKVVTAPFRLTETPPSIRYAPPALAADTEDVLTELGYDRDELVALRSSGAFGAAPSPASAKGAS
jgi:crotonobetainyl-CoA:carnitine CoA-transferase CaiB-like acyl-CoA transferase